MEHTIQSLVERCLPVRPHGGPTAPASHTMGGFTPPGRVDDSWGGHEQDAQAVSDAGAFAIVLEGMVEPLAAKITRQIPIPTIGIGASVDCDGQILVLEDMLGLNPGVAPKFVKLYGDLGAQIEKSVADYAEEVRARSFPGEDHI